MNCESKSAPKCKDAFCADVEVIPQSISSPQQDLFFSDEEIQTAGVLAYFRTSGITKSIRTSDVYDWLGLPRGCSLWERRQELIPAQRISRLLRRAGFVTVRNAGAKARYMLRRANL